MKVGIMFANVLLWGTRDGAEKLAKAAENSGIESLWTVEHVVVPAGYESAYPYSPTGKMPGDETAPIPDPLAWLAFMAAHTKTVRLATGILILPQRNPVVLAKECATIDVLSEGTARARHRHRLARGGVRRHRRPVRRAHGPHRRVHRSAARALVVRRDVLRGSSRPSRNARSFPKPVQKPWHPDRRRRTHEGRRTAGRAARRRLLPRAPAGHRRRSWTR